MRGPQAQSVQTACDADDGQADGVSVFPNLPAGDYLTRPTPFPRARSPGRREAPPSLGSWGRRRRVTFQLEAARSAVCRRARTRRDDRSPGGMPHGRRGWHRSGRREPTRGCDGDDGTVDGDRALRAPPHPRPRPTSSTPATAPHPAGARSTATPVALTYTGSHATATYTYKLPARQRRPAARSPRRPPWSPAPAGASSPGGHPGSIGPPPSATPPTASADGIASLPGALRRLTTGKARPDALPRRALGLDRGHQGVLVQQALRLPPPAPSLTYTLHARPQRRHHPARRRRPGPVPGGCLGACGRRDRFNVSASQPRCDGDDGTVDATGGDTSSTSPPPTTTHLVNSSHGTPPSRAHTTATPVALTYTGSHATATYTYKLPARQRRPAARSPRRPPWSPAPAGASSPAATQGPSAHPRLRRHRRHRPTASPPPPALCADSLLGRLAPTPFPAGPWPAGPRTPRRPGSTGPPAATAGAVAHLHPPRPPAAPPSPCKTRRAGPVPGGCLARGRRRPFQRVGESQPGATATTGPSA